MKIREKLENLLKEAVLGGLVAIASLGLADRVKADIIPANFFATDTAKILKLVDYDSVVSTSNWDNYHGNIKWNDTSKTSVPLGYRVWALDDDKKPCGVFDIASPPGVGKYGLLHVYADDSYTPSIDEGALAGDVMSIYVENKATNEMYNAWFVDSGYSPIAVTFQADMLSHTADILVGNVISPADLDMNGVVNQLDIDLFKEYFNAGNLITDFRGVGFSDNMPDGQITPADIDGFISEYNRATAAQRSPLPSGNIANMTPEPATLGLVGVGLAGLLALKKHRRK